MSRKSFSALENRKGNSDNKKAWNLEQQRVMRNQLEKTGMALELDTCFSLGIGLPWFSFCRTRKADTRES